MKKISKGILLALSGLVIALTIETVYLYSINNLNWKATVGPTLIGWIVIGYLAQKFTSVFERLKFWK